MTENGWKNTGETPALQGAGFRGQENYRWRWGGGEEKSRARAHRGHAEIAIPISKWKPARQLRVKQLFLMLAAWKQRGHDVDIGRGEQPLSVRPGGLRGFVRLRPRRLGGLDRGGSGELGRFDENAEMAVAGQRAQMLKADAG
jgi:hypothetical protein